MRRGLVVVVVVAAALAAGCNDPTGVLITFDAPGLRADTLDVAITVAGDPGPRTATRSLGAELALIDGKRLEADLDLERAGSAVVEVTASLAGSVVGRGRTVDVAVRPHRLTDARVQLSGGGPGEVDLGSDGGSDDLAAPPGSDLATPPPVVVTHLPGGVAPGTAALTVTTSIDTTNFRVDGAAVPAGASFGDLFGFAVLSVRTLAVTGASVRVSGSRALLVVADDRITISGTLDGGGRGVNDGPGARATGSSLGSPGNYVNSTGSSSGGGGGGYSTTGGDGGFRSTSTGAAGPGGQPYGDAAITALQGGSRGGDTGCTIDGTTRYTVGGGGGGAIQLTARNGITVAASGKILAGGGGGVALMPGGCPQNGGGGGGSGGAIFLEAAALTVDGLIHAAGGGGGAGANQNGGALDGSDAGEACPTPGGPSGANTTAGGSGACNGTGDSGGAVPGQFFGGGGGGGAPGRIVLRAHTAPAFTATQVAPTPTVVTF